MDGSTLGESLGAESEAKVGYSSDISGYRLEGSEMGESSTGIFSPGDMSGGNVDGKIEGSPLGEK